MIERTGNDEREQQQIVKFEYFTGIRQLGWLCHTDFLSILAFEMSVNITSSECPSHKFTQTTFLCTFSLLCCFFFFFWQLLLLIIIIAVIINHSSMLLCNSAHTYHAKWVKTESTEQPTTSVLIARNSSILSLKAMISVGQTNVLKNKYQ